MNCDQFILKIDAYIDDELSNDELIEMRAHAEKCDACRAEMEKADFLRETLNGMDDDIVVPLEAQAAWRKAVRAEAQRKNVRKWTRGMYVVAAALVLVLGCTLAMNNDVFSSRKISAAPETASVNVADGISMAFSEDAATFEAHPGAMKAAPAKQAQDNALMIAADGVEEQEETVVASYSAVKKYAVSDLEAADVFISNLAAEYEAVVAEHVDLGEAAYYCVELPLDYQQDFLSSLSVLGKELASDVFEVEMDQALVRINIVIE